MATFKNILKVLIVLLYTSIGCCELTEYQVCQVKFNCTKLLTQNDCPVKLFLDPKMTNGCCHGCRGGKLHGNSGCSATRESRKCAPGLMCNSQSYCIYDRASCLHTVHFYKFLGWKPECEIDGSYKTKQCRGDRMSGRCFCYAETGDKLFGWDWWKNSHDMTCACSLQRAKAEAAGRIDVTLRCSLNGNYEDLQCDSGICWCAEKETGFILNDTIAVPDSLWTYLPCYNESVHGDIYLRKCESAAYAQRILQKALINHGAVNAKTNNIKCNYDGTHGDLMSENSLVFCQSPDGNKMNYATPSNLVAEMNCICARDQQIFKIAGFGFNLQCKDNGNYVAIQNQNDKVFCVDQYGYAVSTLMPQQPGLNCNDYIYYKQEDDFYMNFRGTANEL